MADPAAFTTTVRELAPFIAELGIVVTSVDPDRVEATGEWKPERCTAGNTLHGGYLMAFADSLGAMCATLNLPNGAATSTIESKTNFLRGCTGGTITGVAVPVHVGRRTIVVQTDISRDDGKLVSRSIQTQAVLTD